LPPSSRGKSKFGLLHHVDVARTICLRGGCDASKFGGDGFDVWSDMVLADDPEASPRTELPVNIDIATLREPMENVGGNFSALIQGDWKLINFNKEVVAYDGWWTNDPQTVETPNASQVAVRMNGCENVFLFDLAKDPNERINVALDHPDVVEKMQARIAWYADPSNGYEREQPNLPHLLALPEFHNGTWAPWKMD